jgi:uncharacterized damage-inducible protein DinB
MKDKIAAEFIAQSIFYMEENTPRIEKCLLQLSDSEVWKRPNSHSNSIGNLILHLSGNITQYIISSIGGKTDNRIRDEEFTAVEGYSKAALLHKLKATVTDAINVIRHMTQDELMREREVQGFRLTGTGIIIHVVEHYSYHTGQIAFWTKLLKDKDLGFYEDADLNRKNPSLK